MAWFVMISRDNTEAVSVVGSINTAIRPFSLDSSQLERKRPSQSKSPTCVSSLFGPYC